MSVEMTCVSCGGIKGQGKCSNGCKFSAPSTTAGETGLLPLCPIHRSLDQRDELEVTYSHGCVACSLNERQDLLDMLAPFAAPDESESSVEVLAKLTDFWNTHHGENRVVVSYPAPHGEADQPEGKSVNEDKNTLADRAR